MGDMGQLKSDQSEPPPGAQLRKTRHGVKGLGDSLATVCKILGNLYLC